MCSGKEQNVILNRGKRKKIIKIRKRENGYEK
jgi:hypothetical protein